MDLEEGIELGSVEFIWLKMERGSVVGFVNTVMNRQVS